MFEDTKKLNLNKEYNLSVHLIINGISNPIRSQLKINQKLISLNIYNTNEIFEFNYDILTCEYGNYKIDLFNAQSINTSSDFYSNTNDFTFTVEYLLFKEWNAEENINKITIHSKDIGNWVGFTNLQRELGFDIYNRLFNSHNENFLTQECKNFIFKINYNIKTNQNTFEGKITYSYVPSFEIEFKEKILFQKAKKIYHDFLDFMYLFLGFNLNPNKLLFSSGNKELNNSYYFYKKTIDEYQNNSIYIALANDLFEQYRPKLNIEVLKNYFELNKYSKSFYKAFKKYKMFHYTEEKFLGYFKILENIMFEDEILTDEMKEILRKEENREKLSEFHIKKCKKLKSKDCISYIRFIVFYKKLPIEIINKLILKKEDVKKIVDLRNDISHFNEYYVNENDLEKYIDFLELLVNLCLLKKIEYTEEEFISNLSFYPQNHRVFNI